MRRLRFSFKALLIVLAVACALAGASAWWYRAQKNRSQKEIEFGEVLSAQGASVNWKKALPDWLDWVGDARDFRAISSISGWQPESISDAQWAWLAGLDGASLQLTADMLDEKTVTRLADLKSLKDLLILPPLPGGRDVSDRDYHVSLQPEISGKLPGVNVVIGKAWHHTPLRGDSPPK